MTSIAGAVRSVDDRTKQNLLRQIEYYFSDLSLPYDDFLKSQMDASGAIPVAVLASSPRVISMCEAVDLDLECDREAVLLEILKESDSVRVVEDTKLQRVWPMPDADPSAARSAYLSGVNRDWDEAKMRERLSASKDAESFLPVVSMRRLRDVQRDRAYTGQWYIECESEAKAAALVAAATKGSAGVPCNKAKHLQDFFDKQKETILEQKQKRALKAASGEPSASAASGAQRAREEEEEPVDDEAKR